MQNKLLQSAWGPHENTKKGLREVFYSLAIKRILELMYRKGKTQQANSIKVCSVKNLRIGQDDHLIKIRSAYKSLWSLMDE